MEISINIKVEEGTSPEQIEKYKRIFSLLINKGALDGIRGGQAILHFDNEGNFCGVALNYWPWRRKKIPPLDKTFGLS